MAIRLYEFNPAIGVPTNDEFQAVQTAILFCRNIREIYQGQVWRFYSFTLRAIQNPNSGKIDTIGLLTDPKKSGVIIDGDKPLWIIVKKEEFIEGRGLGIVVYAVVEYFSRI